MKKILLLSLLLVYSYAQAQFTPKKDDLWYPDKVKENSPLNQAAKEKGFDLVDLEASACEDTDPERLFISKERVVAVHQDEDTLLITIFIKDYCGVSFLGEIKFEDDTLDLVCEQYGVPARCDCCYQLRYKISLDREKVNLENLQFKVRGRHSYLGEDPYFTQPIQYEIYLGDTLNLVDKYGQRQGYWLEKDSLGRIELEGFFQNDMEHYSDFNFVGRMIYYYEQSNVPKGEFIYFKNAHKKLHRKYDTEGRIREECLYDYKKSYDDRACKTFEY